MKTAFEILAVAENADDVLIKKAYLQKVKQYPPEQATAQFQKIRTAYEAIKDVRSRIKHQLFHQPEADFDKLLARAFETEPMTTVDGNDLIKLLQSSVEVKR